MVALVLKYYDKQLEIQVPTKVYTIILTRGLINILPDDLISFQMPFSDQHVNT